MVKTVDFDDGAVRVIGERIADSVEFVYGGEDALQAVDGADPFLDFQAEPLECLEKLRLAADVQADDFAAGVEKDVQRTFRDLPRVQLLEAAGRCVSCICEFLFVVRKAVGVEFQASKTGGGSATSRRSGTDGIVRILAVTSSPCLPFPRVSACTRRPFS